MSRADELREAFWQTTSGLPVGMDLVRGEPLLVAQTGPGGTAIFDFASVTTPGGSGQLLLSYRTPLLARDVPRLRERLVELLNERRRRETSLGRSGPAVSPGLVTDAASPSVIAACQKEGLAILDLRGTVVVHAGPLFVHVLGRGKAERTSRVRLFAGKPARITRHLLVEATAGAPPSPSSVQSIATACALSYAYAHGVLVRLEREGFVARKSPRSGFLLRDPVGLLKSWMDSGEKTAASVEGWYVPSMLPAALAEAAAKVQEATGTSPLLTLASALDPEEVHVAGLPHGAYFAGESRPFIEALGGRRITPHNFLVLRAEPASESSQGGVLTGARPSMLVPGLSRVALPQLAVDFLSVPGRGREQAQHLLERYAASLPYAGEPT